MMYRSGERANNSYLNTFILLLKWPLFEPKMPTVQCSSYYKLSSRETTGST